MPSPRIVLLFSIVGLWSGARAQVDWTQIAPAASPTARVAHAMAYDLAADRIVLFGGQDAIGRLADTWLFDGTTWTQAAPAAAPPPRVAHAMAYDLGRGRVVMYGGIGVGTGVLGDTWEWDGQNWQQLAPVTQPGARRSFPMVFHPQRGTVVIWGGYSTFDLNDMWEWNGVDWAAIATANSPQPRRASEMAYDPVGGGLVLFSGYLQGADTWYFDGVNWQQRLPTTIPPGRYDHSMATDLFRNRVVMFGGTAVADTWEWNGQDWLQRTPPTLPAARYDTWLVYDWARQRTVMFSGIGTVADSWEYAAITPASYQPFGSGCLGSNGQVPRLSTTDLPWLGEAFDVVVDRLSPTSPFTFMVTGFSNTQWGAVPLPFGLGGFGLPGCLLLIDPMVSFAIAQAGGTATWTLLIPNLPMFLGLRFFNQAGSFDPGANPAGVTVSNGGDGTIGGR